MIKEGAGHHPHSLRDPKPIADFIAQSVQPARRIRPPTWAVKYSRTSFYSRGERLPRLPQGRRSTSPAADRGSRSATTAIRSAAAAWKGRSPSSCPKTAAPGKPWVFRADYVDRDAVVDLALLAKGFHIVTGPVPYNADGPSLASMERGLQHC